MRWDWSVELLAFHELFPNLAISLTLFGVSWDLNAATWILFLVLYNHSNVHKRSIEILHATKFWLKCFQSYMFVKRDMQVRLKRFKRSSQTEGKCLSIGKKIMIQRGVYTKKSMFPWNLKENLSITWPSSMQGKVKEMGLRRLNVAFNSIFLKTW